MLTTVGFESDPLIMIIKTEKNQAENVCVTGEKWRKGTGESAGLHSVSILSKRSALQLLLADSKCYSFPVRKNQRVPLPKDKNCISTYDKQLTIWIASASAFILI